MRVLLAWPLLGLLLPLLGAGAWAQSLRVPEKAQVGEPVLLEGQDLPPGRFPLQLEGPTGTETQQVEVQNGAFRLEVRPQAPGEYRLRLSLPSGALEGRFTALAPTLPELTPEGLRLLWGLLPLPKGSWLGPLVQGDRAYLAQGVLVVEASLKEQGLAFHFAPARVLALRPGPEALLEEDWVLPIPFPLVPFEGKGQDLEVLKSLVEALKPPKPWPYFVYWTQDPATLSPEDLEAYAQDLKARHHRPELYFGQEGIRRLAEASRTLKSRNPEQALLLAQTLLQTSPLFPESLTFFRETADWLEAQGRPAQALRFQEAVKRLAAWLPPDLSPLDPALWTLGLAYLALMVYLFAFYLPAQLGDLRAIGGYLGGFLRHPLLRLRHLHLAYASLGERLLALFLLAALAAGLLLYGLDREVRQRLFSSPLDQGSLRTQAAKDWLRTLPPTPEVKGLLAYALLPEAPKEAQSLLAEASFPFALALRRDEASLAEAYGKAPFQGPIQTALGLGQDLWGPREPGPSVRTLYWTLLRLEWSRFLEDPLRRFIQMPSPLPPPLRSVAFMGLFLLFLYHLLAFFLPRRKAAVSPTWALTVRLLIPGSQSFSSGIGVVLLFLAAYGLLRLLEGQGAHLLLGVYALHLGGLILNLRRQP
ncbi:hypothetical protein [Thermus caliditerrae]|uniref:hypothetical protein n=1 Tax=Thermus caliditerrae TaxID=1330700 RepID=UPI00056E8555|nr:hypothetical protein [Thermus caliditerrae]